jgi:deoxycytidylate deaminase
MPIVEPSELEIISKPELVVALVAPVGTPLDALQRVFVDVLAEYKYTAEVVTLTKFFEGFQLPTSGLKGSEHFERIWKNMDMGDELRRRMGGGEALALLAAARLWNSRPKAEPRVHEGKAHIFRQLKHPDEVVWLRRIYGSALHVVGVYCPEPVRREQLHVGLGMSEEEAQALIDRDKGEAESYGQHIDKTFHRADLFLEMKGLDSDSLEDAKAQLRRYLRLFFGIQGESPTRDEYGMFLAHSVALRSADLSRQVGAAILRENGDVLGLGCNEVPMYGGGQYWGGKGAARDVERRCDANEVESRECLKEIIESLLGEELSILKPEEREERYNKLAEAVSDTRVMKLTEFGRAVHAEMAAILAAGRVGANVCGAELYTTLFPCHNCAKHIVCVGIKRVVYVEPYPPSLAGKLHDDSISLSETEKDGQQTVDTEENCSKVRFEPFRGVAPRMYPILFSSLTPEGLRLKRKVEGGKVNEVPWGPRTRATPMRYIDRESVVARAVEGIAKQVQEKLAKEMSREKTLPFHQ